MRPTTWSRDGRYLLKDFSSANTGNDVWALPQFGDRKPYPYLESPANETNERLSPDDRWLAYMSDETGRYEVYAQSFPTPGSKVQISVNGGEVPVWSRDGAELFFISAGKQMMTVKIKTSGAKLEVGPPQALFQTRFAGGGFDVNKDGRFLIPSIPEEAASVPMTVVFNWPGLLKKADPK